MKRGSSNKINELKVAAQVSKLRETAESDSVGSPVWATPFLLSAVNIKSKC